MYLDNIVNLMSLVVSSISVGAVLILALQITSIRNLYLKELRANRMERTIQAIQLPSMVNQTIVEVLHRHFRGDEGGFYKPELEIDILNSLKSLEVLATGILSDVYDEEIAYSQLGYNIPLFYELIQRYVYESRESYNSTTQYVQLERLARRWKDKENFYGKNKEVTL